MKRVSETGKWQDNFFIGLHPNAKLLLVYLYDNCNDSGFVEVNWKLFSVQLNMDVDHIKKSLMALKPSLLSDTKKKLFIKDFLFHQDKLPLDKSNKEHQWIINKLESNLPKFNNAKEISRILDKVVDSSVVEKKQVGKKKEKFVVPEYKEWEKYYLEVKPDAEEEKIKNLYDHYISVGWVTSSKTPIVDWQSAVRKNKDRKFSNFKGSDKDVKEKTRTEATISIMEKFKANPKEAEKK